MNVERHKRKTIGDDKKSMLKNAQNDLFADLDEVNELDKKLATQAVKSATGRTPNTKI